jgi:titin
MSTPAAPTVTSTTAWDSSVLVYFMAGADNGSAITDYAYALDGGAYVALGSTSSPLTISGITNDTLYSLQIAAVNAAGTGAGSTAVDVTPLAATVPDAPTITTITSGDSDLLVYFTAGAENRSYITNYEYITQADGTYVSMSTPQTTSPLRISAGLTDGTEYFVSIRAVNGAGSGAAAAYGTGVTTYNVPSAPRIEYVEPWDSSALVYFTARSDHGSAITDYAYCTNDSADYISLGQTSSPLTIPNLTNGHTYIIYLAAVNAAGRGPDSMMTDEFTPAAAAMPGAPVITAITPGNATLSVAFTAGDANRSYITSYEYALDGGAYVPVAQTTSPIEIAELVNGQSYSVVVRAVNGVGSGTASAASAGVPLGVPDAPTALSATAGNAQIVISFTAPASDGGSAITGYKYSTAADGTFDNTNLSYTSTTSVTITGLANGTSYTYYLKAVSATGDGAASTTSATAVPCTVPDAPTITAATAGSGQITLAFTAGATNGSAITDYQYATSLTGEYTALGLSAPTSPITVYGLINKTEYTIYLKAVNAAGAGAASNTIAATPVASTETLSATSAYASTTASDTTFTQTVATYALLSLSFVQPGWYAYNGGELVGTVVSNDGSTTIVIGSLVKNTRNTSGGFNTEIGDAYTFAKASITITAASLNSYAAGTTLSTLATFLTGLSADPSTGAAITTANISAVQVGWRCYEAGMMAAHVGTVTAIDAAAGSVTIDQASFRTGVYYTFADPTYITVYRPVLGGSLISNGMTAGLSYKIYSGYAETSSLGLALNPDIVYLDQTGIVSSIPNISGGTDGLVGDGSTCTVMWTGYFVPDVSGEWRFCTNSDDCSYIWFGDVAISGYTGGPSVADGGTSNATVNNYKTHRTQDRYGTVTVVAGTQYYIRVMYGNLGGQSRMQMRVLKPGSTTEIYDFSEYMITNDSTVASGFVSPNTTTSYTFGKRISDGSSSVYDYVAPGYLVYDILNLGTVLGVVGYNGAAGYMTLASGEFTTEVTYVFVHPSYALTSTATDTSGGTTSVKTYASDSFSSATGLDIVAADWHAVTLDTVNARIDVIGSVVSNDYPGSNSITLDTATATNGQTQLYASAVATTLPPTALVATVGNAVASVAFTMNKPAGVITTEYVYANYLYSTDASTYVAFSPAQTLSPFTFSGLTNGTTYSFTFKAVSGLGAASIASAAVEAMPYTVPDAPSGLVATPGDGTLSVSFVEPASTGGETITNYAYSTDGNEPYTEFETPQTTSPVTISGLTNGVSYIIGLKAVNRAGAGAASSTISAKPYIVPTFPTSLEAMEWSSGVVSISFTAGDSGGSDITHYYASVDGGDDVLLSFTASPVLVTGLTDGVSYSIQLKAANAAGASAASAAVTVTPADVTAAVPDKPTALAAADGADRSVYISFMAGARNYRYISNYEYSLDDGASFTAFSPAQIASPVHITTGIADGTTYTMKLRAVNAIGTGAMSDAVTFMPVDVPGAPSGLTAVPGDGQVNVVFTAGAANGGAISNYMYSLNGGAYAAFSTAQTTSPVVISGLTNGVSYIISLKAVNTYGASLAAAAAAVTPAAAPEPPTSLISTAGDSYVSIAFTAGSTNGAAVTSHQYSLDGGTNYTSFSPAQSASPIVISGLTNGTAYPIKLKAINSQGIGAASALVTATPTATDGVPSSLVVTATSSTTASLSFAAGASASTVIDYLISTNGGTNYNSASTTASPISLSGLTAGATYSILLKQQTSTRTSAASSAVALSLAAPDIPTSLVATTESGKTTIAFTLSPPSGAAVTAISYSLDGGAFVATTYTASPVVISGLTDAQTYSIRLKATNIIGAGEASVAVSVTPGAAPSITVVAVDAAAIVTLPDIYESKTVIKYWYSIDYGLNWIDPTNTVTIRNLSNGVQYTMWYYAVIATGTSPIYVAKFTPAIGTASAPTITGIVPSTDGTSLSVYFTDPTYLGVEADGVTTGKMTDFQYTIDNGITYQSFEEATGTPQTMSPLTISGTVYRRAYRVAIAAVNYHGVGETSDMTYVLTFIPCFARGTKILTNKGYRRIETLERGDMVETLRNKFVAIHTIGRRAVTAPPATDARSPDHLYRCSPNAYPEVFEDLYMTGYHAVLSKTLTGAHRDKVRALYGNRTLKTDGMFRVPVCTDDRATVVPTEGEFDIYNFALEATDPYINYGVYANGLLVESSSIRFMTDLAQMEK